MQSNASLPLSAFLIEADALVSRSVVFLLSFISVVLTSSGNPKIAQVIISSVSVYVINVTVRPLSINKSKYYPMGQ